MATKYRVLQVKGTQQESFVVVGIDFEAGTITSTSEMMREQEMRTYLEKSGASPKEIEGWMDEARKYPGQSSHMGKKGS
jgi:hypothetical protein